MQLNETNELVSNFENESCQKSSCVKEIVGHVSDTVGQNGGPVEPVCGTAPAPGPAPGPRGEGQGLRPTTRQEESPQPREFGSVVFIILTYYLG